MYTCGVFVFCKLCLPSIKEVWDLEKDAIPMDHCHGRNFLVSLFCLKDKNGPGQFVKTVNF